MRGSEQKDAGSRTVLLYMGKRRMSFDYLTNNGLKVET